MNRFAILLGAAIAALPACSAATVIDGGDNARAHVHQSVPSAGISSVRIANVAGKVAILASGGNSITIDAVKHAKDAAALARTQVQIDRNGSELYVHTHYVKSGGFFGNSSGGSVDYTIHLPASADVDATNVSGPIDVAGTNGNVTVKEVSGAVHIAAGRIQGTRSISATSVSGDVTLTMAKNSDAHAQAKTISGAVRAFFPADLHKGIVGESMKGSVGRGSGSINLSTVSGDITIAGP